MNPIHLGLIVDDAPLPAWLYDFVETSKEKGHITDCTLIVVSPLFGSSGQGRGENTRGWWQSRLDQWRKLMLGVIVFFEKNLFCRDQKQAAYFKSVPLSSVKLNQVRVSAGYCEIFDEDLTNLKRMSLDLVWQLSALPLSPEIHSTSRWGSVSCLPKGVSSAPYTAFEAVFRHSASVCLGLKIHGVDQEHTLISGSTTSRCCMVQQWRHNLRKMTGLMAWVLCHLAEKGVLPDFPHLQGSDCSASEGVLRAPSCWHQVLYVCDLGKRIGVKIIRRLQGKKWRWGVGYQDGDNWQQLDLQKVNVIQNPPHHLLADPFLFRHQGKDYCFVEDLDFRVGRGTIAAYEISSNGYERLGEVLSAPFHLSYPYVFAVEGEIFMCPEAHEAGDIRLYRAVDFPMQWVLHKVIMKSVSATDTTVFKKGKHWWMFTNIDMAKCGDHSSELHVFYSDAFDSQDWTPHAMNPVIFDAQTARNGGLFFEEEILYRVFQVQGFDRYGESMGIARVNQLTPHVYEEEIVKTIHPDFLPNIHAAHTFNRINGVSVVDFLRLESSENH